MDPGGCAVGKGVHGSVTVYNHGLCWYEAGSNTASDLAMRVHLAMLCVLPTNLQHTNAVSR